MKPTAKLWLEEKKRRLNTLPAEEELRMRRMKERLNSCTTRVLVPPDVVGTWSGSSTPVSAATSSLLNQNVALLAYINELEGKYCQSEKEREMHCHKLQEASDKNYLLTKEIIALTLDRRKYEVLLMEKRFRERVMLQESDARLDLAMSAAHLFTQRIFRSSHHSNVIIRRAVTTNQEKEFFS